LLELDRESAFLHQIADEAFRTLPAAEASAAMAEVRSHLAESIHARMELGLSVEEAVREAVAAFGDPKQFGMAYRVRAPRYDQTFALSLFGTLLACAIGVLPSDHFGPSTLCQGLAVLLLLCAGNAGVVLSSYRTPQLQWRTLLIAFAPIWIAAYLWSAPPAFVTMALSVTRGASILYALLHLILWLIGRAAHWRRRSYA